MNDSPPTSNPPCAVCRHRPTDRVVCLGCRIAVADQIAYVVAAHNRLPLAQLPAKGGGERVRTSRTAPLPLRLDPLSLTAGGRGDDDVHDAFVPAVRTWVESRAVAVLELVDGLPCYVDCERDVTCHEPVLDERGRRVLVPAGDQAGVLPIPVWTRAWVADWRHVLGHSAPADPTPRLRPVTPSVPRVGAGWVRTEAARVLLGRYLTSLRDAAMREYARDVLGMTNAAPLHRGAEDDPAAREWTLRFRHADTHLGLAADVKYLTTWLDEVCDRHPDVGLFAASLKALHRAVQVALGDGDDKAYLGRCPTGHVHNGRAVGRELWDRQTGEPQVCGFPLWHEPHTSTIGCPRCRVETGPRDYLLLAGHIRRAWPVDRRRRYTLAEADDIQRASAGLPSELRMPGCDECGRLVLVSWSLAMERGDREPMWRVADVGCPVACGEGEEQRLAS